MYPSLFNSLDHLATSLSPLPSLAFEPILVLLVFILSAPYIELELFLLELLNMLFMSTEKYPDVDAYLQFINENGKLATITQETRN